MLRSVAVLVLDELAVFEFGVLCEVFGQDRTADGIPLLDFRVCGPRAGQPVTTTAGVHVVPQHGLHGLRGADLVALPATRLREFPPEALDALRQAAAAGTTMLSVCSGVFALGAAGLLDGRRCTAHWMNVDELRTRHPEAIVDPDVLFVDDGNIVTSAGTAAGIDAHRHHPLRHRARPTSGTPATRGLRLEHRGPWRVHPGPLPIIEGTLIRLQVQHLPVDRAPKPLWL